MRFHVIMRKTSTIKSNKPKWKMFSQISSSNVLLATVMSVKYAYQGQTTFKLTTNAKTTPPDCKVSTFNLAALFLNAGECYIDDCQDTKTGGFCSWMGS